MWPVRVTRDLRFAPGIELAIRLFELFGGLVFKAGQLIRDRRAVALLGYSLKLGNLAFELSDRFFKIEICCHARQDSSHRRRWEGVAFVLKSSIKIPVHPYSNHDIILEPYVALRRSY